MAFNVRNNNNYNAPSNNSNNNFNQSYNNNSSSGSSQFQANKSQGQNRQFSNNNYKNNRKDSPFCTYCKKNGHTQEKCYKLHSFPPGYRNYKVNAASMESESSQMDNNSQMKNYDALTGLSNDNVNSSLLCCLENWLQ